MSTFKSNLKEYYNQEAELRNDKTAKKTAKEDWKENIRHNFLAIIKQENKQSLLELGAGAGHDSQFFMNGGLTVTAIDLSIEMVKKCREKGVTAHELDFYNLSSLNIKYDCIYSINSLLHVPKTDFDLILNEINLVLEPNGLFYMGLYGGNDTESNITSQISTAPRFYAFHSKDYLTSMLKPHLKIISYEQISVTKKSQEFDIEIFHSFIMRKK